MDPFVLRKKGAVAEGLPALGTFEGFLPQMDSLMAYESSAGEKSLSTFITSVGCLARVGTFMVNKARV